MAAAWHAHPNLGAENRRVFDACSDNAVKGKEGAFSLSAYCSAQTGWGRSTFQWFLGHGSAVVLVFWCHQRGFERRELH